MRMDLLHSAPTQIFSLFKLLAYPSLHGDAHGDRIDSAFSDIDPTGRSIIDVGLNDCESLVLAVARGFAVFGIEPRLESLELCRQKLRQRNALWVDVDVTSRRSIIEAQRHYSQYLANHGTRKSGVAYLYLAALSNSSGVANITLARGSSTLAPTLFAKSHTLSAQVRKAAGVVGGTWPRRQVPLVRLDELVALDAWVLKLDVQGFEYFALQGASGLFARHTIAHVLTEFSPRGLKEAGVPQPRALIDLLKGFGFLCFDLRDGGSSLRAPWALPKTHALGVEAYLREMDSNEQRGLLSDEHNRSGRASLWADRYGSFDDLGCMNVAKEWRPTAAPT